MGRIAGSEFSTVVAQSQRMGMSLFVCSSALFASQLLYAAKMAAFTSLSFVKETIPVAQISSDPNVEIKSTSLAPLLDHWRTQSIRVDLPPGNLPRPHLPAFAQENHDSSLGSLDLQIVHLLCFLYAHTRSQQLVWDGLHHDQPR